MARPVARPDARGYFGPYGGRFVPETLMAPLAELAAAYDTWSRKRVFRNELRDLMANFAGRPTPLYFAKNLTERLGGARIFLKREDLLHTGAHKLNNAVGQALLTKMMGKEAGGRRNRRRPARGGDRHRGGPARARMRGLHGHRGLRAPAPQRAAHDRSWAPGWCRSTPAAARLKDAINEAMRDWVTNVRTTHYILGSVLGPDPFPRMVRDFHRQIGDEARRQLRVQAGTYSPDLAIACVGGGSNAIGLFTAFLEDRKVRLVGVEAGGRGPALGDHAARFEGGALGVLHGTKTMLLQDANGQVAGTHSVSAGLDYPAVGPEHALLRDLGRAEYVSVTDDEALDAFHLLAATEGILPALESSHALAQLVKIAPKMPKRAVILVGLSGRGDKDVESVMRYDAERRERSNPEGRDEGIPDKASLHPAAIGWAGGQQEETK